MKSITIKYLPNNTTQEEIQAIRNEFNATHSKDCRLILFVSGHDNMKESLQSFVRARKI